MRNLHASPEEGAGLDGSLRARRALTSDRGLAQGIMVPELPSKSAVQHFEINYPTFFIILNLNIIQLQIILKDLDDLGQ